MHASQLDQTTNYLFGSWLNLDILDTNFSDVEVWSRDPSLLGIKQQADSIEWWSSIPQPLGAIYD